MSDPLILVVLGSFAVAGILAVAAAVSGFNGKIVVYYGRAGLHSTWISLISWPCVVVALHAVEPWAFWLVSALSGLLTIRPVWRSFKANRTIGAGILSGFAKYALLLLIGFCGLIAIGGAVAATNKATKKQYKEAAQHAAVAATVGIGFLALRRLIACLITEPNPQRCSRPAPPGRG